MLATITRFPDPREDRVAVSRPVLSAASENAAASTLSIEDAVKAAEQSVICGNQLEAIRQIRRIGYENQERLPNLLVLTRLSEDAPALVDGSWKPAKSNGAA